jgi:hypothetical protein
LKTPITTSVVFAEWTLQAMIMAAAIKSTPRLTAARNGPMAFAGALDDVRLFQQALRNDQIAAIAADLPIPP